MYTYILELMHKIAVLDTYLYYAQGSVDKSPLMANDISFLFLFYFILLNTVH